jgi:hypothetical protein
MLKMLAIDLGASSGRGIVGSFDGNKLYLPASEIKNAVRSSVDGNLTEKNGESYISSEDLTTLDTVESSEIKNGSLYITLKIPNGNLIMEDTGRVSQVTESTCYTVDLVTEKDDEGYIYTCYAHNDAPIGGLSFMITDEIRMYGVGKYTFTFKARANKPAKVRYGWTMDDRAQYSTEYSTTTIDETTWQTLEFTIDVTQNMILSGELFTFRIMGVSTGEMEYFSIKDMTFIKN